MKKIELLAEIQKVYDKLTELEESLIDASREAKKIIRMVEDLPNEPQEIEDDLVNEG